MLKVNLWKLYITWNMSFTDYHSHFNPQHPQNPWMKYNNTQRLLCSAQKQTTFANTLIQDIPTFNGSDLAQLEDWLTDIETTANQTDC